MKRFIVKALVELCKHKDRVVYYSRWPYDFPRILTSCQMAMWSDKLDQRWGTGVWEPGPAPEDMEPDGVIMTDEEFLASLEPQDD